MNKELKATADTNYTYYKQNLGELTELYNNEYIIIQSLKVIFSNKDRNIVTNHAESLDPGTYLILKVQNKRKAYS